MQRNVCTYMCQGNTLLANSLFFFMLRVCVEPGEQKMFARLLSFIFHHNKYELTRTMPKTIKDTLLYSLGDCIVCFCNFGCVYVHVCVPVFDFEGIWRVFVQQDKKQERHTALWRTLKGKRCGRGKNGHENKVIMKPCQGGEVYSLSGRISKLTYYLPLYFALELHFTVFNESFWSLRCECLYVKKKKEDII